MQLDFHENELTVEENKKLDWLEAVIEKGKKTFIDVGMALTEIKDNRLYRKSFNTFEAYCQDRWGFNKRNAYQLMEATQIANDLCAIAHIPNEGTAREFVSVPKEQRQHIAETAQKIAAEKGRDTINSRDVKEAKGVMFDAVQKPIIEEPKQTQPEPAKPVLTEDQARRLTLAMDGVTQIANISNDRVLIDLATQKGIYEKIDRNTVWGNPFVLGDDGDRETVIENYRDYLTKKPSLQRQSQNLRGKILGCWCYPQNCHGHVLIEEFKL